MMLLQPFAIIINGLEQLPIDKTIRIVTQGELETSYKGRLELDPFIICAPYEYV